MWQLSATVHDRGEAWRSLVRPFRAKGEPGEGGSHLALSIVGVLLAFRVWQWRIRAQRAAPVRAAFTRS